MNLQDHENQLRSSSSEMKDLGAPKTINVHRVNCVEVANILASWHMFASDMSLHTIMASSTLSAQERWGGNIVIPSMELIVGIDRIIDTHVCTQMSTNIKSLIYQLIGI